MEMSSDIEMLGQRYLDVRELQLAEKLSNLLADANYDAAALVSEIIPEYSIGNSTIEPDMIYRSLMYLESYANSRNFARVTRIFILNACWHIEGCLVFLAGPPPESRSSNGPFGSLLYLLKKRGVISDRLALELKRFNDAVYIPAHHPNARFTPMSPIDRATFSILEAALTLMMMRKLSMQLFPLLLVRGVELPNKWKEFDVEWLSKDYSFKP